LRDVAPTRSTLDGRFTSAEDEDAERDKLLQAVEDIGVQIMRRRPAAAARSSRTRSRER